jgi:very-short-patch-repair endonuclease
MGDSRQIDRLASRQHGVVSGSQLRQAGFDKHAVARRLASGKWRQFDYRVFGLSSAAPTWERQVWIALLSRPRAVVGGRSAAHLLGFPGFPRSRPVIVVPGSANARSQIAKVIRSEHFEELEVVRVRGFPVTSVAETLLALVGEMSAIRFEQLLDELLLSGKLKLEQLEMVTAREIGRRRRGIALLRALLEDRLPTASSYDASYLERLLERLLRTLQIPEWLREYQFSLGGRENRVDVYVPLWRLVIEADGRNWHARVRDFEEDRRRDNELAMKGIQVIRLTYRMLKSDPEGCRQTILAVGRVRSA